MAERFKIVQESLPRVCVSLEDRLKVEAPMLKVLSV